jgi:hypothetical protein
LRSTESKSVAVLTITWPLFVKQLKIASHTTGLARLFDELMMKKFGKVLSDY